MATTCSFRDECPQEVGFGLLTFRTLDRILFNEPQKESDL